LALLASAGAANAAETVRFVTCPLYRDVDAGAKSGCWLAEDDAAGRRYDVSASPSKPDWSREVLVEGQVAAAQQDRCGGVVLNPVRTSVLEGSCPRHMLPAEGFAGNKFTLPRRNVAPLSAKRDAPKPPFADKSFHLYFDFDQSFVIYQYDDFLLDQAITWIRGVPVRRVTVTGWAATDPVDVSGRRIAEKPEIARERAEKIAEALRRLGVAKEQIEVRWRDHAQPIDDPEADGLADASRRRVDIDLTLSK
jgi:outer membrane protein OmpA-like peptidoglycan-associated protein